MDLLGVRHGQKLGLGLSFGLARGKETGPQRAAWLGGTVGGGAQRKGGGDGRQNREQIGPGGAPQPGRDDGLPMEGSEGSGFREVQEHLPAEHAPPYITGGKKRTRGKDRPSSFEGRGLRRRGSFRNRPRIAHSPLRGGSSSSRFTLSFCPGRG